MSDAQAIDEETFTDDDFSAALDEAARYAPAAAARGDAAPAPASAGRDDSAGMAGASARSAEAEATEHTSNPFAALARTVAASVAGYHERRRSLFDWIHPTRAAGLPYASLLPTPLGPRGAHIAEAWLASIGCTPAPMRAFSDASAALVRLPVPDCLSLFRLRALVEHVYELRLWIDRPRRALLNEWLGPHLTRMLFAQRGGLTAGRPLDGEPTGDSLAWRGFRLFEKDCGWDERHPMTLLQFALPDEIAPARLPEATGRAKVSNTSRTLVSQLPDLFPTRSW